MKKYNWLIITCLSVFLFSCDDKKDTSDWFAFDTQQLKAQFINGETATLQVLNLKSKKMDSIIFYRNDKKIGKSEKDNPLKITFENEKLGYQNWKALVYAENTYAEITHRSELVSGVSPTLLSYEIVATYPHDKKAYTQGLEFLGDILYESTGNGEGAGTGRRGKSSVRKTEFKTGKILQIVELEDQYFGEGLTILNNNVYQLTWTSLVTFVYDANDLKKLKTIPYTKKIQGWGLCNDGTNLYQSDGTEKIWIVNPENFEMIDNINVYTGSNKVRALNELEWVNGKIYGNVYLKDAIAIIDPKTGAVEGMVNLVDLKKQVTQHPDLDVLNGIAYHAQRNTFFVTGKNWDTLFEIRILE
jgi:glutaminyl-peptide cyclotransferase